MAAYSTEFLLEVIAYTSSRGDGNQIKLIIAAVRTCFHFRGKQSNCNGLMHITGRLSLMLLCVAILLVLLGPIRRLKVVV